MTIVGSGDGGLVGDGVGEIVTAGVGVGEVLSCTVTVTGSACVITTEQSLVTFITLATKTPVRRYLCWNFLLRSQVSSVR